MKKAIIILIVLCTMGSYKHASAQEKFGKTLNLGVGVGLYGHIGRSVPAFLINYEFDVAKRFTLAPFVGFYSYTREIYWGNKNYPYRYYTFRETVIPMGVKGTYYFDDLLKVNEKWDIYAAASVGFVFSNSGYDSDYYGDRHPNYIANPLHAGVHIGAEFHMTKTLGLFLDLSNTISTFGLAIHHD